MQFSLGNAYLNNGNYKTGNILELAHINIEVLELILFRLFKHELGTLSDGIDAAQVPSRVERWVGRFGEGHVREARRPRAIGSGARGAQGAIGRVWLAAVGRDAWLGAFATEESHTGSAEGRVGAGGRCSRASSVVKELGRHDRVANVQSRRRSTAAVHVQKRERARANAWFAYVSKRTDGRWEPLNKGTPGRCWAVARAVKGTVRSCV